MAHFAPLVRLFIACVVYGTLVRGNYFIDSEDTAIEYTGRYWYRSYLNGLVDSTVLHGGNW